MSPSYYFPSSVLICSGGEPFHYLRGALVSRLGIHRALPESPALLRAFLSGSPFSARLCNLNVRARLVRESGMGESHFNLRFLGTEEEAPNWEELLQASASLPGRVRRHSRFLPGELGRDREAPAHVLLSRFSGTTKAVVRSYSANGLFVEFPCSGVSISEKVGQSIRFSLITRDFTRLSEIHGRIVRRFDEFLGTGKVLRGIAIELVDMRQDALDIYERMTTAPAPALKRPEPERRFLEGRAEGVEVIQVA